MKQADISPEEAMKQIQKIFKKRGTKALEMARKEILEEKIECKEAREALSYFITKYWQDLARPSLMSLVCEAVGGNPELTTPIAVPMILISGAIDIHDDIIDQSEVKDGRRTVLGKFGRDIALLAGDALLFKGLTLLNEAGRKGIPARKMRTIVTLINKMFFELGDAESLELQFRGRLDVAPEDYLRVIKMKGADVEAYVRISAVLGDASKREVESLADYGRLLGMLAILNDDAADMTDSQELIHRIKYECLPLPMLYVLHDTKVKSSISSIFLKKRTKEKDAKLILEITKKAGGFAQTTKLVQKLVEEGCSKLKLLRFNRKELTLLIRSML
jgi:geranylgeranyl pyrophosphate synthase